ncbi:MAG: amino acid-binding protein [Methanosarcinales archaeon]|nr:MAG: amino acid-binding protein [Methanosarcinales archaeon]
MWDIILNKFKKYPAQEKVVRLLLNRGFQVTPDGKVVSGSIKLPHTQIANEIGVDRRAVDATATMIAQDDLLSTIFKNIRPIASLREVAPTLNLGVIIVTPVNATDVGILASVAAYVAEHGISIMQAIADDPRLSDRPTLTIITDRQIPDDLVGKLLKCDCVKGLSVC